MTRCGKSEWSAVKIDKRSVLKKEKIFKNAVRNVWKAVWNVVMIGGKCGKKDVKVDRKIVLSDESIDKICVKIGKKSVVNTVKMLKTEEVKDGITCRTDAKNAVVMFKIGGRTVVMVLKGEIQIGGKMLEVGAVQMTEVICVGRINEISRNQKGVVVNRNARPLSGHRAQVVVEAVELQGS